MVMAVRIMLMMMMMMMVMLVKWVMIMIFAKGMFFFFKKNLVQSERIQNYNPRSIVVTSLQPHFLIASRSLL